MENQSATGNSDLPAKKVDMFKVFGDPPDWMTRDYIESVLQEYEKDSSLKILDYSIGSATRPGDNFASIALRLKTTYATKNGEKSKSFIVKIETFQEGFKKELLADALFFETEMLMYTQTLPEMQRLLLEVDPLVIIAPPLAYSSLTPYKIVFIEDISPRFKMSETATDFNTSVKVFEKIAQFHALSMLMHGDHEPLENYRAGFISDRINIDGLIQQQVKIFIQTIKGWGNGMEAVADQMRQAMPTMFGKLMKLFSANPDGIFNVLNHGDFHIKNILFNQEDERQEDLIRLIDFQLCVWATPAIDLLFALYLIVDHEARDRRDDLLRCYHNKLVDSLQKLGYLKRIPTFLDLQVELLRNGLIEVFLVTFMMPIIYVDRSKLEEVGQDTFDKQDELRKHTLNIPTLKAALIKVLPGFLNKGFLD